MDDAPNLERIIELQKLMINFRDVERVIHLKSSKGPVKENDVEHSYSLAIVGWYSSQYITGLSADKVIRYSLVHDLVEVYAGDTYIFAARDKLATKKSREQKALKIIKKQWSDFPAITQSIENYETMSDDESKFVYALDKIMPIILNIISQGHTWHENDISLEQLHRTKKEQSGRFSCCRPILPRNLQCIKTKP